MFVIGLVICPSRKEHNVVYNTKCPNYTKVSFETLKSDFNSDNQYTFVMVFYCVSLFQDGLPHGKLSMLTVDNIASVVQRIEGLNQANVPTYVDQLQLHNICGSVLLTCDLNELKSVIKMSFGDWELFRSVVLQMRELENTETEEEMHVFDHHSSVHNSGPDPEQKFTKPVPPFNVDHKLYMPQASYSENEQRRSSYSEDPRRKRHSSGGARIQTPQSRMLNREQMGRDSQPSTSRRGRMDSIEEPAISYNSMIPHTGSQSFKAMKRKDSFFGEAMMESELITEVVEASGVCTDSNSSDSDPHEEQLTVHHLECGAPTKPGYQPLQSVEKPAKFAVGSVGTYKSSSEGDSDDLEQITTVKSTKSARKKSSKARTPPITKSEHSASNLNGSIASGGPSEETSERSKRDEGGKLRRLFSKSRDKTSGSDSQRTSVASSVFSGADLADFTGTLAELSDLQPDITPASSSEHLALRKIAQKEDPFAPSAFKTVTPGSSRASSRASSYAPSAPLQPYKEGREDIAMELMGKSAEKSGEKSDSRLSSSSSRKLLSQLQMMSSVEDEIRESGQETPKSNASAEEIRIAMPGGEKEKRSPDSNV